MSSAYTIKHTLCLLKRAPISLEIHSSIKSFIKTLNRKGEIIPPCFTPHLILKLSDFLFTKTKWTYFGCIKPNEDIDIFELIGSLSPFFSFYCIHRQKEKNHIHFSVKTSIQIDDFKEILKLYFKKINKSIDRVFLTQFDNDLREKTINYLLRRGNHNTKQDLIDWGLTTPNSL